MERVVTKLVSARGGMLHSVAAHWVMQRRPTRRRLTDVCCKRDHDQISCNSFSITIYLQELFIAIQDISMSQGSVQDTETTVGRSVWKCYRSRSQGAANRLWFQDQPAGGIQRTGGCCCCYRDDHHCCSLKQPPHPVTLEPAF